MSKTNSAGLSFVLPGLTVDTAVSVANAIASNRLDYCTSLQYESAGSMLLLVAYSLVETRGGML